MGVVLFNRWDSPACNKSQQDALLGAVDKGVYSANWRHYRKSFFQVNGAIAFPMSGFYTAEIRLASLT